MLRSRLFKSFVTPLAGILTLLAAGFISVPAARADFRVCNATQDLVGVSIGYRARAGWITEGWWAIEGSSCKTLIEGPLESRYYYLYAEDGERGGRWDGEISMCIAELQFKITGVNNCFARGFQKAGFREYDTGNQQNWMVQLVDDPEPRRSSAPPVTTSSPPPAMETGTETPEADNSTQGAGQ